MVSQLERYNREKINENQKAHLVVAVVHLGPVAHQEEVALLELLQTHRQKLVSSGKKKFYC